MTLNVLLDEAERCLQNHDVDGAAVLFQRAQEESGGRSPLPRVGMARVALLLKRVDDAQALLDSVLRDFSASALALSMRGAVEEARGNHAAAVTFHTRALAIDPALVVAHANLGRLAMLTQQWSQAAASYQRAVEHGGATPELGARLGLALFRAGRVTDAVQVLGHVVEGHPRHLGALLTLVDVLESTQQLPLATELLENALTRFPKTAALPARMARVALRQGDVSTASREARRATQLATDDVSHWLFLASVEQQAGALQAARKALETALKLEPDHPRALLQLGDLADLEGDVTAARETWRRAAAAAPLAWEPLNNLAVSLLGEGSAAALGEARTLLTRAVSLGTNPESKVQYNLALTCLKLGDRAGARAAAEALLNDAPADHPLTAQAHRVRKLAA